MRHEAEVPAIRVSKALMVALALVAAPAATLAYSRDDKDDAEEFEKQLDQINRQMMNLQTQEFDLTMKIQQAQQQAQKGLEDPGKATKHLQEGKRSTALMKYKAVLVASARKVQQFDRRLLPLLKQVQVLQKKQDQAPKPVQAMIDQTAARVQAKHLANVEKIAQFYEKAAEPRQALQAYLQVYAMTPEKERDKNEELHKTLAELSAKAGNLKAALTFYNKIFEAKKPKERYKDKKLAEKVADLHVKTGNARAALTIYRGMLDHIPNDKKHQKERQKIQNKINQLGGR
ncbi:MAG: hypothetical protein R6X20_19350 [Phycisphaerae bacterium]